MRTRPFVNDERALPWVIEPDGDRDPVVLARWIQAEQATVLRWLQTHGAVLFRGFDIRDADEFERVARAIAPTLQNEYLGTSPRDAISSSGYVFSASELPPWYPIPQHNEMSFIANPPERIFFSCLRPSRDGGETPIVDMRRVARDLPADVRGRFESRGVRIVRNYAGPGAKAGLDLWKLKRWDEMFATSDKAQAEARETRGLRGRVGWRSASSDQPPARVSCTPGDGRGRLVQSRAGLPPGSGGARIWQNLRASA